MIALAFAFLLLFVSRIEAAETYKYILYVGSFPATIDKVSITPENPIAGYTYVQESGYPIRSQPSEQLHYVVVKNTDVVVVEITFKNEAEKNLYRNLENDYKLYLFEISSIMSGRNDRGEWETNIFTRTKKNIPVDLNRDWSVVASSQ